MSATTDNQATFFRLWEAFTHYARNICDADGHPKYRFRKGDAYRDPRAFGRLGVQGVYGHARSYHKRRQAEDLILDVWRDGQWAYARKSADYAELGEMWERMHPGCNWGGSSDGNHFEFTWV